MPLPRQRLAAALAASLALATPPAARAQDPPRATQTPPVPPSGPHALGMAMRMRQSGDTAGAMRTLQIGDSLLPGWHPILAALAEGYAARRDTAKLVATLRRMAAVGVANDPLSSDALRPWRDLPAAAQAAQAAMDAARPVVRGDTVASLGDSLLVPEGIAFDPRSGVIYLGSLGQGVVLAIAEGAPAAPFIRTSDPDRPSRHRVLGMKVDTARGVLWAAVVTPDSAAPRGVTGRGGGWAALHAYELTTGRLARRIAPRDSATAAHLLNDMAIGPRGDVWVTDSEGGALHHVPPDRDTLETVYAGDRRFIYPNGIALAPDGRRLWVAHLEGIAAWEMRDGRPSRLIATRIQAPSFVGGIDGLVACRDALVGIQNAGDHARVVRLQLEGNGARVRRVEVLERRHPAHDAPTTGALTDRGFVYIANSGVQRLGDLGPPDPGAGFAKPVLLRLRVANC